MIKKIKCLVFLDTVYIVLYLAFRTSLPIHWIE